MKYLLDKNHKPYKVDDVLEWGRGFESIENRRVALYKKDGIRISTVFLGLDHNYCDTGTPLLFETMVFDEAGGPLDQTMERCSTWEQAEKQHEKIVARVEANRLLKDVLERKK